MKKYIVASLRFAFTAGLIYWLIRSGNLQLSSLRVAFDQPFWVFGGILSVGLLVLLSFVRWHLLLTAQDIPIRLSDTMKLSFVGLFFSTVIPGGVSGDLMKVYFVGKSYPAKRSATLVSILADRIMGLSTLMLFALVALLFRIDLVVSSPQVRSIALVTGIYFCALLAVLPVILSSRVRHHRWTLAVLNRFPFSSIVTRLYDATHAYKRHPARIAGALVTGGFVSLFSALGFYCFGQSLGMTALGIADYCLVIPLIFVTISMPISPAGIGVGQAAALFLFRWIGVADDRLGASLMTLYQASILLFALGGAITFLLNKKELKTDKLDETTVGV